MLQTGSRHHSYLELYGSTAKVSRAISASLVNARSVEFLCDFTPLKFSTTQDFEALLGTYLGFAWFEYDAPTTNTDIVAPIRFGVLRNSADKYSGDGEITIGKRTVVYGKDDQANVYAWQDGTPLGSATGQADWTAVEASYPLDQTNTFYLGHDDSVNLYTAMRIYEAWVKVNGSLILHYRPTVNDTTSLTDYSPLGNTGTVSGTQNTDFRYGKAWNKVVAP